MPRRLLTRSEWQRRVLRAYDGELCPLCGYEHIWKNVDHNGDVWTFCWRHSRDVQLGHEPVPPRFVAEPPDSAGLPF
jgi:hypothetical protein